MGGDRWITLGQPSRDFQGNRDDHSCSDMKDRMFERIGAGVCGEPLAERKR